MVTAHWNQSFSKPGKALKEKSGKTFRWKRKFKVSVNIKDLLEKPTEQWTQEERETAQRAIQRISEEFREFTRTFNKTINDMVKAFGDLAHSMEQAGLVKRTKGGRLVLARNVIPPERTIHGTEERH